MAAIWRMQTIDELVDDSRKSGSSVGKVERMRPRPPSLAALCLGIRPAPPRSNFLRRPRTRESAPRRSACQAVMLSATVRKSVFAWIGLVMKPEQPARAAFLLVAAHGVRRQRHDRAASGLACEACAWRCSRP